MPRQKFAAASVLTDRDQSILTDLARCRVLSAKQLKDAYWPAAKERTCLDRLEQLSKAGYITRQAVQGEKPGIALDVFSLAGTGRKWAIGPAGPGLDRGIVFASAGKSNEVVHQVRTNNCYYALSEREKATWRIGDQLEIEQGVFRGGSNVAIPDASYESDSGDEIFVETDCGSYTGRQIEEKVTAFANHKSIWICPEGRDRTLIRHGVIGEIRTYHR